MCRFKELLMLNRGTSISGEVNSLLFLGAINEPELMRKMLWMLLCEVAGLLP
jgi:hypothetical protein